MLLPGEDDLTYIPMAVRRALDRAGLRITLRGWQGLSLVVRAALLGLGGAPEVDVERVAELLAGASPERIEPSDDPPADAAPSELTAALPIEDATWRELGPVARHALLGYARRGKLEKLRALYQALTSSGASQSTR